MATHEEIRFIFTLLKQQINTEISMNISKTLLGYKDVTSLSVGKQIKHFRTLKELTQKELAKKINTDRAYISEIENDIKFPSIELLKKIIEVLNMEERITLPPYTLFLMNNPVEKIKKYQIENNISNHKLSKILKTNSTYVKKWINGQTVISKSVYEKLNQLGIQ